MDQSPGTAVALGSLGRQKGFCIIYTPLVWNWVTQEANLSDGGEGTFLPENSELSLATKLRFGTKMINFESLVIGNPQPWMYK